MVSILTLRPSWDIFNTEKRHKFIMWREKLVFIERWRIEKGNGDKKEIGDLFSTDHWCREMG